MGLCIGSFLNVVIFRLPRERSIIAPRSFCPKCGHTLSVRDNIPLISYLINLGKCRFCDGSISVRYPLVELVTTLIFIVHFRIWGLETEFFTRTFFFLLVLAMACIDGEFFIIPDVLSLGGLALGLILSFLPGDLSPRSAFLGSIAGGGFLFLVAIVGEWVLKKEAMGMGDVKMIAMIGSFVGWQGVIVTIFVGSLIGSIIFLPLNIRKRRLIPFGIFLAIGGLIAVYFRDPLVHAYISTFM